MCRFYRHCAVSIGGNIDPLDMYSSHICYQQGSVMYSTPLGWLQHASFRSSVTAVNVSCVGFTSVTHSYVEGVATVIGRS